MVLLENVINDYGIKNIKILLMPSQENNYYKWLRMEGIVTRIIEEEEYIDTVYFRNDINGRFEPAIPYLVLQDMIDNQDASIVLQEHKNKEYKMKQT